MANGHPQSLAFSACMSRCICLPTTKRIYCQGSIRPQYSSMTRLGTFTSLQSWKWVGRDERKFIDQLYLKLHIGQNNQIASMAYPHRRGEARLPHSVYKLLSAILKLASGDLTELRNVKSSLPRGFRHTLFWGLLYPASAAPLSSLRKQNKP